MKVAEIKISYTSNYDDVVKITKSEDAYDLVIEYWNQDNIELLEEVKLILLNRANRVLGIHKLSKGGVSQSIVDIKLILSIALKCNATSIILVHNHPSGNLKYSKSDKNITSKLKDACKIVDLVLFDHLIVTKKSYYSFADDENL
jgi:DNA repair protein RadC